MSIYYCLCPRFLVTFLRNATRHSRLRRSIIKYHMGRKRANQCVIFFPFTSLFCHIFWPVVVLFYCWWTKKFHISPEEGGDLWHGTSITKYQISEGGLKGPIDLRIMRVVFYLPRYYKIFKTSICLAFYNTLRISNA